MTTASYLKNNKIWLAVVLLVYFSFSLCLLFFNGFKYIIDPDVTSYISIAQKYLAGDFAHAINGHWSPLVSWLALPLLLLKIRPILAFALEAVITGGGTLIGINLLLAAINVRASIRFLYALALSPLISWYALTEGNPDLLCLCLLTFYLYVIIDEKFIVIPYRGIVAGLLGAVAYLAKSYNFYFFLLHFTCVIFLYWRALPERHQRKILFINGLSALLVFLLISGPWIGLLTAKYHKLTVSTAGTYNLSFIRPGSPGQVIDTAGLLAPPNQTAFSAWEDPSSIKKVCWSPFNSIGDFQYFVKNTAKNAAIYLLYITRNHILFLTIVSFLVIAATFRLAYIDRPFYLFLTTILHPVGYLMLLVEQRYFWFDYIVLYVLSAYLLEIVIKKVKLNNPQKGVLAVVTFTYIAILPLIYFEGAQGSISKFKNIYAASEVLSKSGDFRNTNIASQVADWSDDLYLSYYLHAKYFGKIKDDTTNEQLKKELISYNIQYFFVHGHLRNHLDILKPYSKVDNITIYKVTSKKDASNG